MLTTQPTPTPHPTLAPFAPRRQVGKVYRFHFETVSVTVNLFDRMMTYAYVPASLLQGSALACMFLASKMLERHPLALRDIANLAGMVDPQQTINELEMRILTLLKYDVNSYTVDTCLAGVLSCFEGPGKGALKELGTALSHLTLKSSCALRSLQSSPLHP